MCAEDKPGALSRMSQPSFLITHFLKHWISTDRVYSHEFPEPNLRDP